MVSMTVFEVSAQGNHGYPQPENGYREVVYTDFCPRCGIHGSQIAPFRLARYKRAQHSSFLQLNWVFDTFFVHPDVAGALVKAGITGVTFGPAFDGRTSSESNDRVQLLTSAIIGCAETSRLPSVTCRPDNEESRTVITTGTKNYPSETPYCGRTKYYRPTLLAANVGVLGDAPDLFQTAEWFGAGGRAFRLTLASQRFVELARKRGWRGLEFREVQANGWSQHAAGNRHLDN